MPCSNSRCSPGKPNIPPGRWRICGDSFSFPLSVLPGGMTSFLTAGVNIFGFPWQWALGVAMGLTVVTTLLIWAQLNRLLVELERGNGSALSLDNLFM